MKKETQVLATFQKESPEEKSARISMEVGSIFHEEAAKGVSTSSKKKPSLDFYDNRREQKKDEADVKYEDRFGKFK